MNGGPMSTAAAFDTVLATEPDVLAALTEVHEASWAAVDETLLGVCEVQVAGLLGYDIARLPSPLPAELLAALPNWPTSPLVSDAQRACLAFTEQFVIDVASMDDATVAAVLDALGADGLVNFTNALLVIEQRQRLHLMWERLLPEVLPS
jgi:hypothetical protein